MLVPKLRFKRADGTEYPEWGKKTILEICEPHARIGWQNLRTDEFLDEGGYYLVTGTDFQNGRVNFDTCHYIDKTRYEQDKNIQITNGSILITKDGTLGKIALVENMDKNGTLNAGIFVLQNLDESIYNIYLFQYLTAPYLLNFTFDKSTGGTIKHLNQGILAQFPVPIPCSEEQHKIADFLSTVDEVIAQSEKEVQNLEQQKKASMQKIFSQEVRFKREDGRDYPEWKTDIISNICSIKTGESNSQDQSENGAYPFYIRSEKPVRSNRFLYDCEAVLTIGDGNIGKVFHYVNGKFDLHQRVYIMNEFHNVNAKYFYYYFSMFFYQRAMRLNAKGTVNSVRRAMIADMTIPVPCLEEQQKIADFLSTYDEAIGYAKQELEHWKQLKKGLLQQMFV